MVLIIESDMLKTERLQLVVVLVDLIVVVSEDPVRWQVAGTSQDVVEGSERDAGVGLHGDTRVEEPDLTVALERVLARVARVDVDVESQVVEVVVDLALTGEELLVVGLVRLRCHNADLLLRVVEEKPHGLQADHATDLLGVARQHDAFGERASLLVLWAQELSVHFQCWLVQVGLGLLLLLLFLLLLGALLLLFLRLLWDVFHTALHLWVHYWEDRVVADACHQTNHLVDEVLLLQHLFNI